MYKIGELWLEILYDSYGRDGNDNVLLPGRSVHTLRVAEILDGQGKRCRGG